MLSKNNTSFLKKFVNFLNYYDPDVQDAELRDNYTTQSPVYIKGSKNEKIIMTDNVFEDNIGLSGGALHIDMKLSTEDNNLPSSLYSYSPFVFLKGNRFERNMAFFSGNAIYIKGS
jgi:hypothetical protein